MRDIAFLVAYMICGGHGRRVHTRSGASHISYLKELGNAMHRTLSIAGESQTDRSTARSGRHGRSPLNSLAALLALERPATAWQSAGLACDFAKRSATSHQAVPAVVHSGRLAGSDISMQATSNRTSSLDALLAGPVPALVKELTAIDSRVDVSPSSGAKVIDAVTAYSRSDVSAGDSYASMVYSALRRRGVLRAFGSCSQQNLMPMQRTVQPADQEKVTGFPAEVFVTNDLTGRALELFALTASFWLFVAAGDILGLDPLLTSPAVAVGLVVDRFSLDSAISKSISKAFRGGSRETAIKREAGRFLVAYLLGNPVESCSVGGFNKFINIYDPDLKKGLQNGFLTRKILERHSIVMMSGIAAEVMATGKTESGAIDEDDLADTLKKDKWDQDQMESQARWGISQAVVLLKKYRPAYKALCKALEDDASVGTAIMAIEESLSAAGQLPVESEMPVEVQAAIPETTQGVRPLANTPVISQAAPEPAPAPAPAPARASMTSEDVDTRLSEVEVRLAQINAKLSGKPLEADVQAKIEKMEKEKAKTIVDAEVTSSVQEAEPAKEIEAKPATPLSKEDELKEVDAKLEAIKKRLADMDKK